MKKLMLQAMMTVLTVCLVFQLLTNTPELLGETNVKPKAFPEIVNSQDPKDTPPTAEEAVKKIKLPEGFNITLFASEPDVQQPIAFDIDDRGRLFVAESYTYLKRGWDSEGEQHRDRIIMLEDTDFDGKHDVRKVFHDNLYALSGVLYGFDGVWALSKGKLIHIPDKNKDDKADGEHVVHLDGFDYGPVGHNIVSGLMWGPDGWIYGRHGIQATSYVGIPGTPAEARTPLNASIWRYHPTKRLFEVVVAGTTNPWGLDYNEHGQIFFTNNVIGHLWHVVPGARYERMYGAHFRSHLYELIEETADHFHWDNDGNNKWMTSRDAKGKHGEMGGGHSHCGGMIYLGDNWPKAYRGNMFMCNTHGRRLNQDRLVQKGTGYTAEHGKDMMFANEAWFRGVELKYGPDGSVYVTDWTDLGECHDHDGVHRTSGRIYKVFYGGIDKLRKHKQNLQERTNSELVQMQGHENAWHARHARRILQERALKGDDMTDAHRQLKIMFEDAEEVQLKLRALWGLYVTSGVNDAYLYTLLSHSEEHIRVWAIKLLTDTKDASPEVASAFKKMAWHDKSGLVRRFLASAMTKTRAVDRWQIAGGLADRQSDKDDKTQQLMIWYGIEPIVAEYPKLANLLIKTAQSDRLRRFTARRLMSELTERDVISPVLKELGQEATPMKVSVLQGMADATRGWGRVNPPAGWKSVVSGLSKDKNKTIQTLTRELEVVFGSGRAMKELRTIAFDGNANPTTRKNALQTLLQQSPESIKPEQLHKLLNDKVMYELAARGLSLYDNEKTPGILLGKYHSYSRAGQAAVIDTMSSRLPYAKRLLSELGKRVPKTAVTAYHARQMLAFNNDELNELIKQNWGEVKRSSAEKVKQIAEYKKEFTAEWIGKADLMKGRQVFKNVCASCHKLNGEGANLAPDLTGSNRDNLDYLLGNMVDPSAIMPDDFRASVVTLKDGRTLMGYLRAGQGQTHELVTMTDTIVVRENEIQKRELLPVSLMPEGMLETLTREQRRDLIGYLMNK